MAVKEPPDWVTECPRSVLASTVVEMKGGLDQCTIFPENAPESTLTTHWITASGDAFVDLADAC